MGKALYRKYRSKTFNDVVGQDHIVTVLTNSIKSDNLSHAYLFTGPRGVGKTSVARILAKEANKLDSNDENFYSDIVEIDAASNRRIDEIRDLREKVVIAPSQLRYKVYIIDEVHMLTREAFNALLKTLEEPPSHAIFILATTDYHKVPETIISRCMRLSFKPISVKATVKHLGYIAKKENIKCNDESLKLIAEHSEGSFRDAISMLDQLSSINKPIDEALVELMLGIPGKKATIALINDAGSGNVQAVLAGLETLFNEGATSSRLITEISKLTRNLIASSDSFLGTSEAIELLDDLTKAYSYPDQRLGLEMALIKLANAKSPVKKASKAENVQVIEEVIVDESKNEPKEVKAKKTNDLDEAWQTVLNEMKNKKSTIYGIARMAEVSADNNTVYLGFKFAFHQKQMSMQRNKDIILKAFSDAGMQVNAIEVTLLAENDDDTSDAESSTKISKNTDVSSLSNIFGSVEVLES